MLGPNVVGIALGFPGRTVGSADAGAVEGTLPLSGLMLGSRRTVPLASNALGLAVGQSLGTVVGCSSWVGCFVTLMTSVKLCKVDSFVT